MTNWKTPAALVTIGVGIGLGLQLWYWPQLPERVATHFDAQGRPDGWMGKLPATLLSAGLVSLIPLLFVGISLVIRWSPTSMINLPHREYWLAAEQRDATLMFITNWIMWFSVSITIFLVAINHLTFIANRDAQPLSATWFLGSLGAFLFSTVFLLLTILRRFANPAKMER